MLLGGILVPWAMGKGGGGRKAPLGPSPIPPAGWLFRNTYLVRGFTSPSWTGGCGARAVRGHRATVRGAGRDLITPPGCLPDSATPRPAGLARPCFTLVRQVTAAIPPASGAQTGFVFGSSPFQLFHEKFQNLTLKSEISIGISARLESPLSRRTPKLLCPE